MRVVFFIFLALIFGTGCSFKTAFTEPDTVLQKSLTWTKKGEIYNSLEIKASVFATYLNPLGKAKSSHDEFVVSIFVDDDFKEKKKAGLHNPDISLSLGGVKPLSVKELDEDSEYKKLVPFKNEWAHYYLVKFPKSTQKVLILKSQRYGKTQLKF